MDTRVVEISLQFVCMYLVLFVKCTSSTVSLFCSCHTCLPTAFLSVIPQIFAIFFLRSSNHVTYQLVFCHIFHLPFNFWLTYDGDWVFHLQLVLCIFVLYHPLLIFTYNCNFFTNINYQPLFGTCIIYNNCTPPEMTMSF